MADLRERGIVTKMRTLKSGQTVGGIPFTRGPLAYLLRNRFYIGEVVFKGEILPGEQTRHRRPRPVRCRPGQARPSRVNNHKTARSKSEALLTGRIFDDRGNRMSPSHARKRGVKYRYYISSALAAGPGRASRNRSTGSRQPRSRHSSRDRFGSISAKMPVTMTQA